MARVSMRDYRFLINIFLNFTLKIFLNIFVISFWYYYIFTTSFLYDIFFYHYQSTKSGLSFLDTAILSATHRDRHLRLILLFMRLSFSWALFLVTRRRESDDARRQANGWKETLKNIGRTTVIASDYWSHQQHTVLSPLYEDRSGKPRFANH